MRPSVNWLPLLPAAVLLAACGRALPPYEARLPQVATVKIRTTAYTESESDHVRYGARTAFGTPLLSGPVHSAAADWSRFPAGTIFRIRATNEIYQVDDYGWMVSGTNTIDLYKPSRSAMNAWGVRRVTIDILRWGDPVASYRTLHPRDKYRHVHRMVRDLEKYCL